MGQGNLRKIAEFCGVSVPAESWPLIEEKVSLKWMKDHESIFKYDITSDHYKGNVMSDKEGSMIRKGVSGDGKDKLSPAQEEVWEKLIKEYFGDKPGLSEWIQTGGTIPPL